MTSITTPGGIWVRDRYFSGPWAEGAQRHRPSSADHAGWLVTLDLPHVAFGNRHSALVYRAVIDDFGTLVAVADASGTVVLR